MSAKSRRSAPKSGAAIVIGVVVISAWLIALLTWLANNRSVESPPSIAEVEEYVPAPNTDVPYDPPAYETAPAAPDDYIEAPATTSPPSAPARSPEAPAVADGPFVIRTPQWRQQPGQREVQENYPYQATQSAVSGEASLRCTVLAGGSLQCSVVRESPIGWGFGAAAQRVARYYRMAATVDGRSSIGGEVDIRIQFRPPVSAATLMDGGITEPTWVQRPTGADLIRLYPRAAMAAEIEGRVLLDCYVGIRGDARCSILEETPSGQGFGQAALELSREFRFTPRLQNGRPVEGGRMRVPIRFEIE